MITSKKFALLLRRGMGLKAKDGTKPLPDINDEDEWRTIIELGAQQAVIGILERGVRLVPPEHRPPYRLYLQFCTLSEKIATLNKKFDKASVKVTESLEEAGFQCCILKGQGNALTYPDPTARIPGDIDIWVLAPQEEVIAFARKALSNAKATYHHVEYVECDGVEVELHYRPAFLNNPLYNWRLQRWFRSKATTQYMHRVELADGVGTINVPSDAFNRIFLMVHMMNHLVHNGLGIRQLMDYYFLLRKDFTPEEREQDVQLLRHFGLYNITAAVMYTMRQLFAMPTDRLLVPPDKRRGMFLLKEVFEGGNFGQYSPLSLKARSQWDKNLLRLRRDWRLLTIFPSECLWEPLFRWWHYFWRLRHN